MSEQLEYESKPARSARRAGFGYLLLLKLSCLYFLTCMVTLPFINKVWWNDIPMMALPQLPKLAVAAEFRRSVVMPAIMAMGLSRGSGSPDYILSRPFGLAGAYLIPLVPLFILVRWKAWRIRECRRWMYILLFLAVVDFLLMLFYAPTLRLSLY